MRFVYADYNKPKLLSDIEKTIYSFDRLTINKLRGLSREEIATNILSMTSNFIASTDSSDLPDESPPTMGNYCLPCNTIAANTSGKQLGYCLDGKLIIDTDSVKMFSDILAADLMNPLKSRVILNNLWMDTSIDYLKFTESPSEIITIYKLR